MRPVSLLFLCLCFALAQPAPKPAVVSGRVIHALTGEPLRKVTINLTGSQRSSLQGTTDAEGAFRLIQVPAGEYRLFALRPGFLRGQYPTTIKVDSGGSMTGLEVRLTPQAVLTGKVVDEDGDPVEAATVMALAKRGTAGQRAVPAHVGSTNDLGEFRLPQVSPGKYTIMVRRDNTVTAPGSTQEFGFAPTYYPAAREESAASPVVVTAGRDVSGLVIPLRRSPFFRVRGRIEGMAKTSGRDGYQLSLVGRDGQVMGGGGGGGRGPGGAGARVRPDGTFETSGVPAGSYVLLLMQTMQGPPLIVGRANVEVGNGPVEGIVLFAGAPLRVAGQVRTDAASTVKLEGTQISFRAGPFGFPESTVKADGTFEFKRVGKEKFRIAVTPPPGTYVKSVSVNGQEVLVTGLDLTAADSVGPLEVLLGTKPATVNVQVKESTSGVAVLLGADANLRQVRLDAQGRFSFSGLAPGEYRLLALETAEMIADLDEEAQRRLQGRFEKVKLAEGETATTSLTLVTQKEFEAGS